MAASDYAPLLARAENARFVLLGEATHGTREFYRARAEITKRLVVERGFRAVAVEADWPDAYRVNRYVQGADGDADAEQALGGFERFPTWMWRNDVVLEFVGWLRAHNDALPEAAPKVGFYGLDLYSLFGSMQTVLRFLEQSDPGSARRARERYACFDHFARDAQTYGYATALGLTPSCEHEAVAQLVELARQALERARREARGLDDDLFDVEQNARVVVNAEEYYRHMFSDRVSTWNLRDGHMVTTLEELARHLGKRAHDPKIAVWAHNSHLGGARATTMGNRGEWNVGRLVRERHRGNALLVGFTTYAGTVTAASDWDAPAERMTVSPALPESYESLFHEVGLSQFLLCFDEANRLREALRTARLERAIGVIYRPETERVSHYFEARLSEQFDAVLHVDRTRALEPLERGGGGRQAEPPETYPVAV